MNAFTTLKLAVAAAALLAAGAASTEPGAVPQRAEVVHAQASAAVAAPQPVPQSAASAPIDAASDAAVPVRPPAPALDWGYTPRRSFQSRSR